MTEKENKEEKNSNAIHLNALLKTYSVKEISGLFSKIDKQIISLHECSANDFLQLNNGFKDIYKQSDQVSQNIIEILKAFNASENKNLYQVVRQLFEKLNAQFEILDYKIVVVKDLFEKLYNQIRHIFFPIKNFRQNLISMSYLIANIKVSIAYKKWKGDIDLPLDNSEKYILEVKKLTDNLFNTLNSLSKNSKKSQYNLKELKESKDKDIEGFLSEVQSTLSKIDIRNTENRELIPEIKNNIENLTHSNTEIVKKLQYHDIIRQKMEHIQNSHNELIEELVEFNESGNNKSQVNQKVKCFMRIRDISGLQAAQLLHANKEYQSAIEVITNNFISIGDNINDAAEKCDEVHMFGSTSFVKMFQKIDSYINKTNIYLEDYNRQSKLTEFEIDTIYKKFKQTEQIINEFKDKVEKGGEYLKQTIQKISKVSENESELKDANNQFSSLLDETNENFKKLNHIFSQLFSLNSSIEGFVNKTDSGLVEIIDFSDFKNDLNKLKQSGEKITHKLEQNKVHTRKIIKNIKQSISKIQYYDYFEKTIQKIISELNSINLKLKKSDQNGIISKEENLEMLKQHYTMHTEFYIHDKIAKGDNINIDFDISEDDEVEFF